jgi:hypothetical protein
VPVNITDVNEFTAPVTAPAGGDAHTASSVVEPIQKLSNRTRWFANILGGASGAAEWVYPATRERQIWVPATRWSWYALSGADAPVEIYPEATDPAERLVVRSREAIVVGVLDLERIVPTGGEVTRLTAVVKPGTTRASAGNRMRAYYNTIEANLSPLGISSVGPLGEVTDDGTDTQQILPVLNVAEGAGIELEQTAAIDWKNVQLVVRTGNDSDTNKDLIYGAFVGWFDPGPRNI